MIKKNIKIILSLLIKKNKKLKQMILKKIIHDY